MLVVYLVTNVQYADRVFSILNNLTDVVINVGVIVKRSKEEMAKDKSPLTRKNKEIEVSFYYYSKEHTVIMHTAEFLHNLYFVKTNITDFYESLLRE